MQARFACVGELAWDVSASWVSEKRRQGHLLFSALLSLPMRHPGVPATDGARVATS